MPAAEPRFCVAQVSEEARDAFCDAHSIDRTAFAEVVGDWLAQHPDELPPLVAKWVRDARDLKNQRRRRG